MNRYDLEQAALQAVCPCWYYDLANDVSHADYSDLKKILEYPAWLHIQSQKYQPQSSQLFLEDLAQCPETEVTL